MQTKEVKAPYAGEMDTVLPCGTMTINMFFREFCAAYMRTKLGIKSLQYKQEFLQWVLAGQARLGQANMAAMAAALKGVKSPPNFGLDNLMALCADAIAGRVADRLSESLHYVSSPMLIGLQVRIENKLGHKISVVKGDADMAVIKLADLCQ